MDKSIYTREHVHLSHLLRRLRVDAGLRQQDVAAALDMPQSFVSKYESGERRLDFIELRQVCLVLGVSVSRVAAILDDELAAESIGQDEQRAALRSDEPAGPSTDDTGPAVDDAR